MTIILIIITAGISILAFNNRELFTKLQFNAYQVYHRKEYYRLITHGFVHANWWHLFVNMLVLFFFGRNVEYYLSELTKYPTLIFIVFYLAAMIFASSIALVKHKDDVWYNAIGASGATSAILFFGIFFDPWQKIIVYFLPVPGIIFAILYVVYSHYQSKKGGDNIAHDAHLLGAIFGFIFPLFINLDLYKYFISKLFGA